MLMYFFRSLAWAYLAFLSWISLTPITAVHAYFVWQDKIFHLLAFVVLGGLFRLGFEPLRSGWIALLFMVAMSLEVGQNFVSGRTFELWDLAANGLGLAIVLIMRRQRGT